MDETEGFQCLGHSNWTICSTLSPFCSGRISPFPFSYWEANSYYPRGNSPNPLFQSFHFPTQEIVLLVSRNKPAADMILCLRPHKTLIHHVHSSVNSIWAARSLSLPPLPNRDGSTLIRGIANLFWSIWIGIEHYGNSQMELRQMQLVPTTGPV